MKITHLPFGKAKIINDVLRFSIACVMALAMMGHLFGVGVGTVISMVAIGAICQVVPDGARGFTVVPMCLRALHDALNHLFHAC